MYRVVLYIELFLLTLVGKKYYNYINIYTCMLEDHVTLIAHGTWCCGFFISDDGITNKNI